VSNILFLLPQHPLQKEAVLINYASILLALISHPPELYDLVFDSERQEEGVCRKYSTT
jgi:hypothetical protein